MRVNLSAPPSGSKAAEPATNSAELSEAVEKGGFLAQMDQIWNQASESITAVGENGDEQDSAKPEKDPLLTVLSAILIPGNAQQNTVEVPYVLPPEPQSAADSITSGVQTPLSARTPSEPQDVSNASAFAGTPIKSPNVEAIDGGAEDLFSKIFEPNFGRQPTGNRMSPDQEIEPPKTFSSRKSTNANPSGDAPLPKNPAISPAGKVFVEAVGQSASRRLESSADAADELPVFDDVAKADGPAQTVPPAKSENIFRATLEKVGTSEAYTSREDSRSAFLSWALQQNRPDGAQTIAKPEAQVTVRQQQISVPVASSAVALSNTGAASAPGRAEVSTPPAKDFILQLADRIQVQLRDGKEQIRIQLQPDSLGHLEIRAESTVNGVIARIVAESGSVKNYLETNLHLLQQSLQDQGLKVEQIQVSIQDSAGFGSFSGYATQSGHAGPRHQGKGSGRSSEGLGFMGTSQPEELVIDPLTWVTLNPNIRFHTIA